MLAPKAKIRAKVSTLQAPRAPAPNQAMRGMASFFRNMIDGGADDEDEEEEEDEEGISEDPEKSEEEEGDEEEEEEEKLAMCERDRLATVRAEPRGGYGADAC